MKTIKRQVMTMKDGPGQLPLMVTGRGADVSIFRCSLVREGSLQLSDVMGAGGEMVKADSPEAAVPLFRQLIGDADREYFVMAMLNARSEVIGVSIVSIGTLSASLVHPREVFKPAILASAAAIIVCHNHPSGDPQASPEDRDATRRLSRSGELLGIPLMDHIILGDGKRFFSFKEQGLLS